MKILIALSMILFIASCATNNKPSTNLTSVKDFTDPDYVGFKVEKLLLISPANTFDVIVKEKMKAFDVDFSLKSDVFLPTRKYNPEDLDKVVFEEGFDSLLIVSLVGDDKKTDVVGYNTNSYGHSNINYGAYYGGYNHSGTSQTRAITSTKRQTIVNAKLYDVKTKRVVWVADITTYARGEQASSEYNIANEVAHFMLRSLWNKGHITFTQEAIRSFNQSQPNQ